MMPVRDMYRNRFLSAGRRFAGGFLLGQILLGLFLPLAAEASLSDCLKAPGSLQTGFVGTIEQEAEEIKNKAAGAAAGAAASGNLIYAGSAAYIASEAQNLETSIQAGRAVVNAVTAQYYAQQHPLECATVCYMSIDPSMSVGALATVCAQCQAIAGLLDLKVDPAAKATAVGLHAFMAYACATGMADLAKQIAHEAICDKGPKGCCISVEKPGQDGKGKIEKEECRGQKPIYYGDCYCIVDRAVVPPDENKKGRYTYNDCDVSCKNKGGRVDLTQGIGRYQAESVGVDTPININPLCFKPEDCVQDGGEFAGMDSACPAGQGKCIVPEPTITLSSPILNQINVTGIRGYVTLMFRFVVLAAVVASAVVFIFGGFKYILSSSVFEIGSAKENMVNGLVGLILTLTAVVLLNTVNPVTARYDKLSLYMVNKIQFATFNWCRDYKPVKPSRPLRFSDSGDPPGQLLYEESKWEITDSAETMCGKEYYIEGVVGQRCNGTKCEKKNEVCLPCSSGVSECGDRKIGFACVKALISGTVRWSDGRFPTAVKAFAVCNWIQTPPDNFGYKYAVDPKTPDFFDTKLSSAGGKAGAAAYVWPGTQADLDKMDTDCKDHGGLRGVMLGVVYKDTEGSTALGATIGAAAGGVVGGVLTLGAGAAPGAVAGGVVGAAVGGPTINDVLIVSKKDCGNTGTSLYPGYADGGLTDKGDIKDALFCGGWIRPGQGVAANLTPLILPESMWTRDELRAALTGEKPIVCDFTLTKKNAPSDPGKNLMFGCESGWCPAIAPKCNEKP